MYKITKNEAVKIFLSFHPGIVLLAGAGAPPSSTGFTLSSTLVCLMQLKRLTDGD
jgi:hypothetical protein